MMDEERILTADSGLRLKLTLSFRALQLGTELDELSYIQTRKYIYTFIADFIFCVLKHHILYLAFYALVLQDILYSSNFLYIADLKYT